MSIADHFEHAPDARFIRTYHAATARRQFHVSLILVAAFAALTMTLGFVLRFDVPASIAGGVDAQSISLPAPPAYAGKL